MLLFQNCTMSPCFQMWPQLSTEVWHCSPFKKCTMSPCFQRWPQLSTQVWHCTSFKNCTMSPCFQMLLQLRTEVWHCSSFKIAPCPHASKRDPSWVSKSGIAPLSKLRHVPMLPNVTPGDYLSKPDKLLSVLFTHRKFNWTGLCSEMCANRDVSSISMKAQKERWPDFSPHRLFTTDCSPQTVHHTDCSPQGLFTTRTIHHMDCSPQGLFTTWTVHHKDCSSQCMITTRTFHHN